MEAFLREFLPRLLVQTTFEVYPFQGKTDLLGQLSNRLRGYSTWLPQGWRIVVVVDRDDDDCEALKHELEVRIEAAGLVSRTMAAGGNWQVASRIAIEELEAWYFGDWETVRRCYPRAPAGLAGKAQYRDPDAIRGGTWEALERILQRSGYFDGGLRKTEIAAAMGRNINILDTHSHSFAAFRDAIREIAL